MVSVPWFTGGALPQNAAAEHRCERASPLMNGMEITLSHPPDEFRLLKLRTAVLLARGREARARAERLLERGQALRERSGDHHENVSALVARSNRLARHRALCDPPGSN